MSREIPLTKGYVALVDDSDFESISKHKWHADVHKRTGVVYAARWEYRKEFVGDTRKKKIKMHNEIMGSNPGLRVDHISRDSVDNRRVNLRWATHSQNMMNRKFKTPKSGFRGVHWSGFGYQASVTANGKTHNVGFSKDAVVAARSYDEAAKRLHGSFAVLNFPENPVVQGGN